MKPLNCRNWSGRIQSLIPPANTIAIIAGLCLLMREPAWAAGVVTSCSEGNLRAAMAGGGTVTFACDGTITLADTISNSLNTVLDGSGHQITISGNHSVRVFYVNNNVSLTISNLTIAGGLNTNGFGGGIYNAGNLMAMNCVFVNNTAIGPAGAPNSGGSGSNSLGGAIYNLGFLNVSRCTFQSNSAVGGDGVMNLGGSGGAGGDGYGGAIENSGTSIITECWLASNSANGGNGGAGGDGGNNTFGQPGGMGGNSGGGAIGNFGTLTMSSCLLAGNSATGGLGAHGGNGGFSSGAGGLGGSGGSGGDGNGGALFNSGSAVLLNSSIALNLGAGNQGGGGGSAGIGVPGYPHGGAGSGGNGGSGYGAMYDANGQCYLTNCTVALNRATPGTGGFGGGQNGVNGINGVAGGLKTVGASLMNTLLSGNTPTNCIGAVTDANHSLSSDGSCAFTNLGSLNNTDPRLGPLADNGGPTWTIALLPGSPAIDAGVAVGAPATDQRGVPRPQGPGVDIGAFEYQYIPVFTGVTIQNAANCQLQMAGLLPTKTFTLQISSNLLNWQDATNFTAGPNGMFQCVDPIPGDVQARFYRLKSGTP
jgi:hypothetical protein